MLNLYHKFTSAISILGRWKDEAHGVANSSIRVLQLACVNNIPDKCSLDINDPHCLCTPGVLHHQPNHILHNMQNTVKMHNTPHNPWVFTWVDALAKCLSAPRCFQGLQAVRHTQQCDSHGQPLNGKDQNCYSSFPYLHHDCMVRGVTPEAKFFKLKHRDVMSSSCAVGQGGHLLKVCMEREIFKTVSHLLLEIRVQVTDCHISCHSW